ncbi:MAG: sel1 repeat family protein [archaeon]|nr:sel1 repeat family protein [archaeon]
MGKTVLCNVSHYGRISHMMAYAMACHRDDDCYLLLDEGWFSEETAAFISSKTEIPPFKRFVLYNENLIPGGKREKDIVQYFDKVFDGLGFGLDSADEVYTCFDTVHAFGIYLSVKGKHHTLIDTNLSTSTDNSRIFERTDYHRRLGEYRALTWNSPLVDKVVYTLGESFEEIKEKLIKNDHPSKDREPAVGKVTEFHTLETAFGKMGPDGKKAILDFFTDNIPKERSDLLLMTSSFFVRTDLFKRYLYRMDRNEAYLMPYRFMMDRVKNDSNGLIVKAHPNDAIPPELFDEAFPDATYIPGYVPSDIMKFLDMDIDLGISPGSNSISTMDIGNTVTFPRELFRRFELMYLVPVMEDISDILGCGRVSLRRTTDDLCDSLKRIFDHMSGSLLSVGYYSSWDAYTKDRNHPAYPFINIDEGMPSDAPEGKIVRITVKAVERAGVLDLKPKYFLLIDQDLLPTEYSFNIIGRYSGTIVHAEVVDSVTSTSELSQVDKLRCYIEAGSVYSRTSLAEKYLDDKERYGEAMDLVRDLVNDRRYPRARYIYMNALFRSGADTDTILSEIDRMEDANFRDMQLGRLYCSRSETEKGIEHFKKAYGTGNANERKDVCGWLWSFKTELTDRLHFELCSENIDKDPIYRARIARCYRDGRGVEKDIAKACRYMGDVAENDEAYDKDYCGILWAVKDEECDRKHFEISLKHKDEDTFFKAHLARCYRDGRGVEKDLPLALQYMKEAAKDNDTMNKELCGILWSMNTPETDAEHFRMCEKRSENGDPFYLDHLARAYQSGRGVEKDVETARKIKERIEVK